MPIDEGGTPTRVSASTIRVTIAASVSLTMFPPACLDAMRSKETKSQEFSWPILLSLVPIPSVSTNTQGRNGLTTFWTQRLDAPNAWEERARGKFLSSSLGTSIALTRLPDKNAKITRGQQRAAPWAGAKNRDPTYHRIWPCWPKHKSPYAFCIVASVVRQH